MMVRALVLSLLLGLTLSLLATDSTGALAIAQKHVAGIQVYKGKAPVFTEYQERIETTLQDRDPETSATSYLHGIKRHAARLLTPDQTSRWNALLESRLPELQRLHDERNVLRGIFFSKAWELPLAKPENLEVTRTELNSWLQVWLDLTFQERIAHHRLFIEAMVILDPKQREALARGEWDAHVKKSTGHQRAYFGDRIVTRALGKPNHPQKFQEHSSLLEKEHRIIQKRLLDAEQRWRRLTTTQPTVSEDLLAAEWQRTSEALGAFFLHQVKQQDLLTRTGYDIQEAQVREHIARQPAAELQELQNRVSTKLLAGQELLMKILSSEGWTPR